MRRSINLVMAVYGAAPPHFHPTLHVLDILPVPFSYSPACWQCLFIFRFRNTDFRRFPKAGIQSNAHYLSFTAITTVVAPWKPLSCSGSLRE